MQLASETNPLFLFLFSPFTSLKAAAKNLTFMGGVVGERFKNIEKIEHVKSPILMFHGKSDNLIPHSHSEALAQRARKTNNQVQVVSPDNMTHNDYDLRDLVCCWTNFVNENQLYSLKEPVTHAQAIEEVKLFKYSDTYKVMDHKPHL